MIVWIIIGMLAIIFVLPSVLLSNYYADKVETEMCKHCIYDEFDTKNSPCYRCIDCDHFERKVEDG